MSNVTLPVPSEDPENPLLPFNFPMIVTTIVG